MRYPKFQAAVDAFIAAIDRDDDAAVDNAMSKVVEAQKEEMPDGVSDAEGVYLQFLATTACIRNHLRLGDRLSAIIYLTQLSMEYEDMCYRSSLAPDEKRNIRDMFLQTVALVKGETPEEPEEVEEEAMPIGKCALCGQKEATCTGSHMAPHFLIQPFLSYDGASARDTEVINETKMVGLHKERKWGRAVPADTIDDTFGYVPEPEKLTVKDPALTRDNVFCPDCEKHFSLIEAAYAPYFRKHQPCPDGAIAYLFWLGVFWRLSVGKMALRLSKGDENAIGAILQRFMPYDTEGMKNLKADNNLGQYCYSINYCSDIKGELSGVIGMHVGHPPYHLLIGNYLITLFGKRVQAAGIINDYNGPEQWKEIPFIEYWKGKQKILDANAAYDSKHLWEEEKQYTDLVKGDHLEKLPSVFPGPAAEEIRYEEIKGKTYYGFKIPGSLQKIIQLTEDHPELDTPEKRFEKIKEELGYTIDEVQEMFDYWHRHQRINKLCTKPGKHKSKKRRRRR